MSRNTVVVALVAVLVFAADQFTKYLVVVNVGMGGAWSLIPGLLTFVPGVNTGTACGYFPQFGSLFTFAPFLILAIVILFYRQQRNPGLLLSIGTGLIIGGAFGNLADRLRFGHVIDFILVLHWPVFNVADAAVSSAVVLLLFWSLREDAAQAQARNQASAGEQVPNGDSSTLAPRVNSAWKLFLPFLGLLAVLAVAGFFLCVYLPTRL